MASDEAYWHQDKRGNWHGELGESTMMVWWWEARGKRKWLYHASRHFDGARLTPAVNLGAAPTAWVEDEDKREFTSVGMTTDPEHGKRAAEELARLLNQIKGEEVKAT